MAWQLRPSVLGSVSAPIYSMAPVVAIAWVVAGIWSPDAPILGRLGDWGRWREAVDGQRWRSRKVLR